MNSTIRVLFIVANPVDVRLVQEELAQAGSSTGIHLAWVDRLDKGLEYVSRNQIEAILLDLSLPDSSGLETLERIVEAAPSIPVIVMTGISDEMIAMQAVQAGAQDYLVKGEVDGRLLTRAIRYAIERKQTEVQLAATLEFTERVLTSSPVGVLTYKLTGECVSANKYAALMVGATVEQLEAQNFRDLKSWKKSGLYQLAEAAIASGEQTASDVHIKTTFKKDAWWTAQFVTFKSGTEDLLLLTISDITARKHAEEAVRESEENYRQLFDAESDAIFLIENETSRILQANHAASLLYGYSPEELLTKKNTDLSAEPEQTRYVTMHTPVVSDQVINIPLQFDRKKDGTVFPVEITGRFFLHQGRAVHIAAVRDITERKRAEETLRVSENRFRLATKATNDVIWEWNAKSHELQWSENALVVFGYLPEEIGPDEQWWDKHIHPDDREGIISKMDALIAGNDSNWSAEYRFQRRDGSYAYVSDRGYIERDANGEAIRMVGAMSDITQRKQAEAALRESEQRFRRLFTTSPDAVLLIDPHDPDVPWPIVDCNEAACRMNGYMREELIGQPIDIFNITPATHEERAAYLEQLQRNEVVHTEVFHRHKDGYLFPVEISTSLINFEGRELVMGIDRDITGRKRAEEALRASETRFRSLIENGLDYISLFDAEGTLIWESPVKVSMLDYQPEEFIGKNLFHLLHPDDRHFVDRLFAELLEEAGGQRRATFRLQHSSGGWISVEAVATNLLHFPDVAAMVVNYRDITERKRAEEELRASEERFRALIENSNDAVALLDRNGVMLFESPAASRILGFERAEFIGRSAFERVHPMDMARVKSAFAELIESEASLNAQFRYQHKDGSWRWIEAVGTNMLETPAVGAIVLNYRDITGRKEAEEKILFQSNLLGAVGSAVIATDMAGRVLYWNAGAESLFGWSSAEALGNVVVDLTTAEQSQEAAREILEQLGKGETLSGEFLLRRKDGTTFLAFVSDSPILDSNGNLTGIIGVSSDITELKRAQEAVAASQKRFQALVEHAPDGIALLGLDGKLRQATPSTYEILGYTMEEAQGHEPAALTHPDDLPALLGLLNDLIQNPGKSVRTHYRFRHKDGSWRWLESTITNLIAEPSVQAIVFNYRDITERKQSEEDIRSRNDELTALYTLSRALADAERLGNVLELVSQHAVQSVRSTFARVALVEGNEIVIRAGYPIRELDQDLLVGEHRSVAALPHCQSILQGRDPVVLSSSSPDVNPEERKMLLLDYVNSLCLIPLWVRDSVSHSGQALGLLMLGEARNLQREPFSEEKNRLAHSIANQAATAVNRIRLREQTESQLQRLAALHAIDQAINSSLNLPMTLKILLQQVTAQLGVHAADVLLLHPGLNLLEFAAGHGFRGKGINRSSLRLSEPYAGLSVLERRLVHIPNLEETDPPFTRADLIAGEDFAAFFAIPLVAKGQVKGVLEVFHRTPLDPEPDWLAYLETLAGQAAIAIDSAELYEGLQRSNAELRMAYDTTIEGWSGALDLRDKETEGHTRRVTELTIEMARAVGIREAEIEHIRHGALLHDIGKMGVPDRILLKPGPLDDQEWDIMKQHPVHAYELLSPIAYLRPALDIPYCHHEKWDGTGYPRGLNGEQIPLPARIFSIIDVWDALTSDRPYRPAWTKEETLEYIQEQSGKHFDPKVVDVFLQVIARM